MQTEYRMASRRDATHRQHTNPSMTDLVVSTQEAMRRRRSGVALHREGNTGGLPAADCAVLGTFSLDLFPPLLLDALAEIGLYGDIHLGPFGQIAQEVANPGAALYSVRPSNVIMVPAAEDVLAPVFARPRTFESEAMEAFVQEQIDRMREGVRTVLERLPDATCYVVAMGSASLPAEFVLDPAAPQRGQTAVEKYLDGIRTMSAISSRVIVVDWDWHLRATGAAVYHDERLWYTARMRLNPPGLAALAVLIARHIAAYRGSARKVAVVDLDNTLWGGVVGEAGLSGLQIGEEGLGLAFQDFQRELLRLHDAGVLLAIASKNNPDDALEVLDQHSGMVLKREHFAAMRINWQDKVSNIRALAEELNLGIDSLVFLDDNPVEREWIRQGLPSVLVPELPEDPALRPGFLRRAPFFSRIRVTEADVGRAESYLAQKQRSEFQSQTSSFEDFLASLEQELTIEPVHEGSVARAAQMCQRTNQFNLTTLRYTAADLERLMDDEATALYTLAVRDRFGESGITGLGVIRSHGDTAELDVLLLSCRVLGRKVEDAFLAVLAKQARERGARYLVGRYSPTAKNSQVASFYPDRGFEVAGDGEFRLNLETHSLSYPPYIKVEVTAHA